jgi:hypothetical protein
VGEKVVRAATAHAWHSAGAWLFARSAPVVTCAHTVPKFGCPESRASAERTLTPHHLPLPHHHHLPS